MRRSSGLGLSVSGVGSSFFSGRGIRFSKLGNEPSDEILGSFHGETHQSAAQRRIGGRLIAEGGEDQAADFVFPAFEVAIAHFAFR
jgi:hypothetical protein